VCMRVSIELQQQPFSTALAARQAHLRFRSLFSKYGGAVRLVLPPSRTVALVELPTPQEARAAFRGLAYRRFHNEPIYLEVHRSSRG
jgi:hypothetical protein